MFWAESILLLSALYRLIPPSTEQLRSPPREHPSPPRLPRNLLPLRWSVVIADNASTDATLAVAEELAATDLRVSVLHLDEKGRGRALKAAWLVSEADIVAYMDVDLSTNLWSLLPLVAPLATGWSDVAIGSRLLRGAMVTRQWKREVISRCYNLLVKAMFGNRFSDAQCGFKAVKSGVARELLAEVEDNEWFFDTELLLVEERGLRISEVPVDWVEDLDSRVKIASTAAKDVKGLLRARAQRLRRRLSKRLTHSVARQRSVEKEMSGTEVVPGEMTAKERGDVLVRASGNGSSSVRH